MKAAAGDLVREGEGRKEAKPYRLRAYVVLLLTTGIGPEEARALRSDHLDLDARTVAVWRSDRAGGDTKTPTSRRTRQTSTTELVYRRELRPVITTGAELMDMVLVS